MEGGLKEEEARRRRRAEAAAAAAFLSVSLWDTEKRGKEVVSGMIIVLRVHRRVAF